MSKVRGGHPDDGELLRYADGELSGRDVKRIQGHLAACWECRAELAELERTISDCVRYRQTVLREHLPEPPAPWPDIYRRFDEFEKSEQRPGWAARLAGSMRAFAFQPRRWAAAVAVALVVALVVDQLRNAPAVRAAELLEQATTAEQSRIAEAQWVQLSSPDGTFTRSVDDDVTVEDTGAFAELRPLFEQANYDWRDPLSAEAFSNWRDGLPRKQDEVTRLSDDNEGPVYRIRTSTDSSNLTEATLMLAVNDLHAVEGALRFRDYGLVEMTPILEEPPAPVAETQPEPVEQTANAPSAPVPAEAPREVAKMATPAEELQVFALLRQLGADLGEPVDVSREAGQVVVRGVGVTPSLGQRIEQELAALPDVSVQFTEPVPAPLPSQLAPSPATAPRPEIEQLETELEQQLGGRAFYERFVDDVLKTNDQLMARVHALRRLAERFPVEVESQLDDEDLQLLSRLRHEHAIALLEEAVALEERSRLTLESLGAESSRPLEPDPLPDNWQDATETLLAQAREAESLIVSMLGAAAPGVPVSELPSAVLTSVSQLRQTAAEYARGSVQ